jgi:stage V sporulation protein G
MSKVTIDVRAYPIENQESNTKAFASASFHMDGESIAAIHGIRVVQGEKGLFVTMPQSMDKNGEYHDIAFPIDGDLRKEMNKVILAEYKNPTRDADGQMFGRQSEVECPEVKPGNLNVRAFPIRGENNSSTLAFANVTIENLIAIKGVRVVNAENGPFVSMPQSKDKEGNYHDIAFPLTGDLRKAINRAVLSDFEQAISNEGRSEHKQSIGDRIQNGKEQAAQYSANRPPQQAMAKKAPGLNGSAGLGD